MDGWDRTVFEALGTPPAAMQYIASLEAVIERLRQRLADEKGCVMCNFLERRACFERHEEKDAEIERLQKVPAGCDTCVRQRGMPKCGDCIFLTRREPVSKWKMGKMRGEADKELIDVPAFLRKGTD